MALGKKDGFTLIEVMVTMAIVAVLSLLVVGAIANARRTQEESIHRQNAKTVQAGMEAHYSKFRAYCSVSGAVECKIMTFTELEEQLSVENIELRLNKTACDDIASNPLIRTALAGQSQFNDWDGGGKVDLDIQSATVMIAGYDCLGYSEAENISIP